MVATHTNELAAELRENIQQARQRMARLAAGAGGIEVCAELSDAYDELVRRFWHEAAAESEASERMALVATGGWGRRELCPFSDIDFILLAPKKHLKEARVVADKLLYPLWDARVDVGHALRDPGEAAKLARKDLASATALLDLRHVAGDREIVDTLRRATAKVIAPGGNPNDFVARLVAEKEHRHERFGDSLYLLEPNLKHGIGALRDLQTAVWAVRARWSVTEIDELVGMGHMSSRQVAILRGARDFLLEIRALLQLTAGRKTDQLTFEIQESIAPGLYPDATLPEGDIRPAVAPAVEALMRHYYLHARGVVEVNERLLESTLVPARRKPRIKRIDSSFLIFNGKLALNDARVLAERPSEMLRLFRVALDMQIHIYGHTKELISETVLVNGQRLTGDPVAARYFMDALVDPRDNGQPSLLEQMHQLGLLNVVMPEFAPCTCRVQHDLYHVYTVDQHQLYAVAMLKRLARGELADQYPTATAALAGLDNLEPLYLGTLLHDIGKPLGKGHAEKGARLASSIAKRLGMGDADVARTEYLVRQHLTMSHLSQRRDLSDPEVIARFASRVGDEETLTQLYILTLVDTAMTSPNNMSAWKEQLLRELFTRTRVQLRGGAEADGPPPEREAERVRRRAIEIVTRDGADAADVERIVSGIDERFFTSLTPRQVARHVRLAMDHEVSDAPVALSVACYPLKGHSELAIVSRDVPGLLSAIAGVLSANRVDVLAAVVGCRSDTSAGAGYVALDLFYVRDLVGRAIPVDDSRWARIQSDLIELLQGGRVDGNDVEALLDKRRQTSTLAPRVTPGVPTNVHIDNDASADYTIVEVFTRDRLGALYAMTHALAEQGLDIHIAKVATEGEKVADIFYVGDGGAGGKIEDPTRLEQIRSRIEAALAAVD